MDIRAKSGRLFIPPDDVASHRTKRSEPCATPALHVLRLTPHFYWPQLEAKGWPVKFDAIGGMQTQIFEQVFSLSKAGVRQTVITLKIPGAPATWQADERTTVYGVRVPLLPIRSRLRGLMDLNLSWLLGALFALPKVNPKPDIVHVHWSGVGIPPLLSLMLSKFGSVPVVCTVHCSSLATYHPMSWLDGPRNALARRIEQAAVGHSQAIVVLTPRVSNLLLAVDPTISSRLKVVPDALDVSSFRQQAGPTHVREFKQEFGLPFNRPIIGYVGRIAREKGWRTFVDVVEKFASDTPHFVVCGDGNERDILEKVLAERQLTHKVTITGYLPHKRVAAAIASCEVMLLTSQHEEFGSVLLEAMAVGTPAVAFEVGGVPHVLANGQAGMLVPVGDVNAMANAVRSLLDAPLLRAGIVDAALLHVQANFRREAATEQMIDIYNSVVRRTERMS